MINIDEKLWNNLNKYKESGKKHNQNESCKNCFLLLKFLI